jgi:hypothetical protein
MPIDLPQLLLGYSLRRQTIAVFFENIVHAALGAVRLFVETAFFLLMAVVGCAYGHHFLPAVTHLLFLHLESSHVAAEKMASSKCCAPILLLPIFR